MGICKNHICFLLFLPSFLFMALLGQFDAQNFLAIEICLRKPFRKSESVVRSQDSQEVKEPCSYGRKNDLKVAGGVRGGGGALLTKT